MYRVVGYGDKILAPLFAHLLICIVLTIGLLYSHIHDQLGRAWAVLWRLFVQPLRFFLRDESSLKLSETTLLPNGWPSTFAPLLVQVVGAVLVAMSLNAIRRLVKAR
jgi:hypothetical protein